DIESHLHKKPRSQGPQKPRTQEPQKLSAHNEMSVEKAAEIGAEVRFVLMRILISTDTCGGPA
ncbi:hypothetical protein KGQ19_48955, partial [Catenulispora sp. NL8]